MSERTWKVLAREPLYRTPYGIEVAVETVELPDGRVVDDFYQLVKPPSVIVAAETPDGRFVALHQYLHGPRRVGLTFPGGMVAPMEDPQEAARRELLEETGYAAEEWTRLGAFGRDPNQGFGSETHFIARNAVKVAEPDSGDLEESEVVLLTREEVRQALFDGRVPVLAHAAIMAMVLLRE